MYHDLLVRIKNGEQARKRNIRMKFSGMDFEIAQLLSRAGYVGAVRKKAVEKKQFLEIDLPGDEHRGRGMQGMRFVSAPGRRVYVGYRELKPIKQGYGLGILSTSRGIMTTGEAKKQRLGGEYLFQIW